MATVIRLDAAREAVGDFCSMDFDRLLKIMVRNCHIASSLESSQADKMFMHSTSAEHWFERQISDELIRRKLISRATFICGLYVAKMLGAFGCASPAHDYAADYLVQWESSHDPALLKCAGDFCFLICGVFPKRGNRRLMRVSYYREMGEKLYYQFYAESGREVGVHMSSNFATMEGVVRSVLRVCPAE